MAVNYPSAGDPTSPLPLVSCDHSATGRFGEASCLLSGTEGRVSDGNTIISNVDARVGHIHDPPVSVALRWRRTKTWELHTPI
jgi:hypothetical protein